jgi:fatty acid desaturase
MMDANDQLRRRRQTFLAVLLTSFAALFCLLVLIFITWGYFFYVLLIVAAMIVLGFVHYFLWGRAMSRSVEGEREEEQLRQRATDEGWPMPDPRNVRRL